MPRWPLSGWSLLAQRALLRTTSDCTALTLGYESCLLVLWTQLGVLFDHGTDEADGQDRYDGHDDHAGQADRVEYDQGDLKAFEQAVVLFDGHVLAGFCADYVIHTEPQTDYWCGISSAESQG